MTVADAPAVDKLAAMWSLTSAGYTLIPVCSPTAPHEHVSGGRLKPCKAPGKVPDRGDWPNIGVGEYTPEVLAGGNYGVLLRDDDLVVDVDPRNFKSGDAPLRRLIDAIGPLRSYTVRTGGGGLHIYLKKPPEVRIAQDLPEFPGVEFKTAGRQVVGPGSIHAAGQAYAVTIGTPAEVAQAPAALLELLKRPATPVGGAGLSPGDFIDDAETRGRFCAYLRDVAGVSVEGQKGDDNAFKVACRGRDFGLPPASVFDLMFAEWNPRCEPPWGAEDLRAKVANAYHYARGGVGADHPAAVFGVAGKKPAAPPDWVLRNDRPTKCLKNSMTYLRLPTGGLFKIFAKNDFTGRIEFVNPAPWHNGRLPVARGVGDHDLQLLRGYLAARHRYESSPKDLEDAITNVAYEDRFHPVREYLEGLEWDGVNRLDTWLAEYCGAIDEGRPEYLRAAGRKILCAAVLRVMRPGIKFDHVLVLEGDQDIGKSTVVDILGGQWASDAPVDPHSRDTIDALQGRWIVEMAEMEAPRKAEEDALKAFITRKVDRVRLAYGRTTGEYPRQCVFIATKNPGADGTYLRDTTGNRRWWPVRLQPAINPQTGLAQVKFGALQKYRDQLFAEAMVEAQKIRRPEELSMDTTVLKEQARAGAALRLMEHEWTERIAGWIAECDAKIETRRECLTVREVFVEAMRGEDTRLDRRVMLAVAGILRNLGWAPGFKRVGGRLQRVWRRAGGGPMTIDEMLAAL